MIRYPLNTISMARISTTWYVQHVLQKASSCQTQDTIAFGNMQQSMTPISKAILYCRYSLRSIYRVGIVPCGLVYSTPSIYG